MIFEPPEPVLGVPHRMWSDMCEAVQIEKPTLMIRATRGRSIDRQIDQSIEPSGYLPLAANEITIAFNPHTVASNCWMSSKGAGYEL